MMRPMDGELLAWSRDLLSPVKEDEDGPCMSTEPEPEVVYWKGTNTLGVQGHPEYLAKDHPFPLYVRNLIAEKLNVAL